MTMSLIPTKFLVGWTALFIGAVISAEHTTTFYSQLSPCPDGCYGKPENWTVYSSTKRLDFCNVPQLLDFALYTPLDDLESIVRIRACSAGSLSTTLLRNSTKRGLTTFPVMKNKSACTPSTIETRVSLDIFGSDAEVKTSENDAQEILLEEL
jgi:hypothetical protein